MVKASKLNGPFRCTRGTHRLGTGPGMVPAAGKGTPEVEMRTLAREAITGMDPAGNNPRHAVDAPLLSLGHIVEKCCDDEVGIGVPVAREPASRTDGVELVARGLRGEQAEEVSAQVVPGESEVTLIWRLARFTELADSLSHQSPMSLKTWLLMLVMNQPRMLYWGATKPMTNSVMRIPMP